MLYTGVHKSMTCFWAQFDLKRPNKHISENLLLTKIKKLNLSLCLTKHHNMKTFRGNGGIAPRILHLNTKWR
jgi:hypothetical protein